MTLVRVKPDQRQMSLGEYLSETSRRDAGLITE